MLVWKRSTFHKFKLVEYPLSSSVDYKFLLNTEIGQHGMIPVKDCFF